MIRRRSSGAGVSAMMSSLTLLLAFCLLLLASPSLLQLVRADEDCTTCAAGKYAQPSGLNSTNCITCEQGFFCPGGCDAMQACAAGTASAAIGASDISTCEACDPNSYSGGAGAISCTPCPAGFSCALTGQQINPAPCAAGTFATLGNGTCLSCPVGTFSLAGSASCTICPAGSQCSDRAILPTECSAGTSATLGASPSVCTPCADGTFAAAGAAACQSCPNGWFTTNKLSCTICPAGYSCNSTASLGQCAAGSFSIAGSSSCALCPEGWTSAAGASRCVECPAGSYCGVGVAAQLCAAGEISSAGSTSCTPCAVGTTAIPAGRTSCTRCPAGYECPDPSVAATPCTDNTYSHGGAMLCTECPDGFFSNGGFTNCTICPLNFECTSAGKIACPAGEWSPTGSAVCQLCPAGYACPAGMTTLPQMCSAGWYSGLNATECTQCAAGDACPDVSLPPSACSPGSYSAAGARVCTPCPAGSKCPVPALGPEACSAGQYALGSATACTLCEEDFACPNNYSVPIKCPKGYTSAAGDIACTKCAAGFTCVAGQSEACPDGTYSLAGVLDCTDCPAGFACADARLPPVPCQLGTWAVANQTSCQSCPPGHRCPYVDQSTSYPCIPGTFSAGNNASCTVCPAGYACPDTTFDSRVACSSGTWSVSGATACTGCPAGMTCPNTKGTGMQTCPKGSYAPANATMCTGCSAGSYCPYTDQAVELPCPWGSYSEVNATACTVCPAGFQCPSRTGPPANPADVCGVGRYSLGNQTACTICAPGMACPFNNMAPIVSCPSGTYAPAGNASCTQCLPGFACPDATRQIPCDPTFYSYAGATVCSPCPSGFQCNGPSTNPVICAPGTFSSLGNSSCVPCVEGFTCPKSGMARGDEPDFICPRGHFCPAGTASAGTNPETRCPNGTYGASTGLTASFECTTCPAGYFCDLGTSDFVLNVCPQGYACPAGTGADVPGSPVPQYSAQCPPGTWNPLLGATNSSACLACPEGFYCKQNSKELSVCPPGFFCPVGTQNLCPAGVFTCDTSPPSPCPAGRFSSTPGLVEAEQCEHCPSGAYCPAGSLYPTACPAGTFNPSFDGETSGWCLLCPSGHACPRAGLHAPSSNCSTGHYCPQGTVFPSDNPCAPGTYSDSLSAQSSAECLKCPAGFTCGFGTGGSQNPPSPCAQGYFCPLGSATAQPCPAGTFSNQTTNTRAGDCLPCPSSYSCGAASVAPTAPCVRGHFCPEGTAQGAEVACAPGSYMPLTGAERQDQCIPCPAGHFCPLGSWTPSPCPAGTYSNSTSQGTSASCAVCPGGYTCPDLAQATPYVCGRGFYSSWGSSANPCATCEPGYFCPNETTSQTIMQSYPCTPGAVCEAGVSVFPLNNVTRLCPKGHFCSGGNANGTKCAAGTYNPVLGITSQDACLDCPPGQFCTGGEATPTGNCSAGHFCTGRAATGTQYACPVRTYRSRTGGESESSCAFCPGGFVCNVTGLVAPILCPQGFYCSPNSTSGIACPKGTYGGAPGLQSAALCTLCDAGKYCATPGLSSPSGNCSAGFYCTTGAENDMASGQPAVGGPCPLGGYCPSGSRAATPCPDGTYGNATGLARPEQCTKCPAGFYCQGTGINNITGICSPGYFCVAGSEVSQPASGKCPTGHYCPAGSGAPYSCPQGTFQTSELASSCSLCPAGYFCDAANATNFQPCPVGSYCPDGSSAPTSCPPGSIGERSLLKTKDECTPCPLQYYCTGGKNPAVLCGAGVYCPGNQTNVLGVPCPTGSWCGIGSASPTQCGVGSYQPLPLQNTSSACLACTPGAYCSNPAGASITGLCAPGYYCPSRSESSSGAGPCPINTYCAGNNSAPFSCAPGTFNNGTGASTCRTCLSGFYCPGATSMTVCPGGSWCAAGAQSYFNDSTGRSGLCPNGTYGLPGFSSASQCMSCPAGSYCATSGLPEPTGLCAPGYMCLGGAINPYGSTGAGVANKPCTNGYYCPAGSLPTACPVGTYMPYNSSVVGAGYLSNCTQCPPSFFCGAAGATNVTGFCAAGFYCAGNASTATPMPTDAFYDSRNGQCQPGQYCPVGSRAPLTCPSGTYSSVAGSWQCSPCSPGYFCPTGSTTATPSGSRCPAGFYCSGGTVDPPPACPNGTYSPNTDLTSVSQCIDCPAGKYCSGADPRTPTGNCSAGFLCMGRARISNPTDGVTGMRCPAGTFCVAGAVTTATCTLNHYCSGGLGQPDGLCAAGAYCLLGETNAYARPCPAGSYCRGLGAGVEACPAGTFSDQINATSSSTCNSCTAGQYCNSTGSRSTDMRPCPAGMYCLSNTSSPSLFCTVGHRCPLGTAVPEPCGNGTFQDAVGQSVCKTVPAGYYSDDAASSTYIACPAGSYCPSGTNSPTQYRCPPGTFNPGTRASSSAQCVPCTPGFYCDTYGMTSGNSSAKLCSAGYYCLAGATTPMPNGTNGNICPLGGYCPAGSSQAIPCAPGKQASAVGQVDDTGCKPCDAGYYCSSSVSGAVPPCDAGFYCISAATTPTPNDNKTGIQCPPGTFCVSGQSSAPTLCLPGTYNPSYGAGFCPACLPGHVCDQPGMTTLSDCPAGHYCAGSNSAATPCPAGRFSPVGITNLQALTQCAQCTSGKYCDGSTLTAPTGNCSAGFLCSSGASSPTPVASPCPKGYFCPAGIDTPTPCPAGTFNPSFGLQSEAACTPCTPGAYCATQSLLNVTGLCTEGFYCPSGSKLSQAQICPAGSYCPAGSAAPIACPDASYNSQTGRSSCLPCAPGWTCTNGSTTSQGALCPLGYFCEQGKVPAPCSQGSYGQRMGLQSDGECAYCPAGQYCRSGQITGNCTAGYLCRAGNFVQNPSGPLDAANSTVNGGPCPPGFYCPEGVTDGIACPDGTSRLAERGTQESDCGPCIAGYTCLSNVPILCPQGFFCPINNTAALACPPGTYGPAIGGFNLSSCVACAPGYTCNAYNMSDYSSNPCPPGHFCPTGSEEALECPGGTYRSATHGQAVADCTICPVGSHCPSGSVAPERCSPGTFCPQNSTVPTPCPPGYYCATPAADPLSTLPVMPRICEAGYFCPEGASSPHLCVAPFYCPQGSPAPMSCPLGSYNVTGTTLLRTSLSEACGFCPAGTYSIDPLHPICQPCTPGYVCGVGTNTATPMNPVTDFGYQCGLGQYCPLGSTDVQYCPPGTYNPSVAGGSLEACLPCLNNSFSAEVGASTCTPCGASAYAGVGATTCICNGTYRAYQLSDGSCKCKPGYEFYDHSNALFDGDSPFACTPIVFSECQGQNRNSQGKCVSDEEEACNQACAGSALRLANVQCDPSLALQPDGYLDVVTQVCTCAHVPLLAYCDEACRLNQSVVTLSRDGTIGVVNMGTGYAASFSSAQLVDAYGFFAPQLACTRNTGCTMSSIVVAPSGHRAIMGIAPTMAEVLGIPVATQGMCNYTQTTSGNYVAQEYEGDSAMSNIEREHYTLLSAITPSAYSGLPVLAPGGRLSRPNTRTAAARPSFRSLVGAVNPYVAAPTIDYLQTLKGYYNPTLCLQQGESVFWQIDSPQHYPVYQKDNFLNTNDDFDYGVFEQLGAQLRVGAAISTFAYTFYSSGVYVFADSANEDHLTIIAVLEIAQPCPAGNRVLPTSSASLKPLGVSSIITPMTAPDLVLIWALLGMFLGLVFILAIVSKLKQTRARHLLALGAQDDSAARNDFKQLYLEIRAQKQVHKALFNKQRDHFRSECDRICAETEQVKALLATKMTDGRGFVDAAINLLLQELTARNSYGSRQQRRETDMFSALSTLARMLSDAGDLVERPLDIPTDLITEHVDLVISKCGDVIREAEKERVRKRHLQSNAGIIGDEIVKKLTEHAFDEEGKENAFLAKLKVFRQQAVEYRAGVGELQSELAEKVRVLQERRNLPAIESATLKAQRRVSDMASGLSIDLDRLLGLVHSLHDELKQAREETVEDENEALEVLEQRKLDVEAQAQTGIFKDLEEDLAEAIRLFLLQARKELLPMQPAFDQAAMMTGGMTLGRGFGMGETGGGAGGTTGGARGAEGEADASATMAPADMVEATSAELTEAADEEAERARKAALENAEDMSVEELRQLYATMRQREEMMERLQRAEEERQKRLAEELLKSSALEPADELLLNKAREVLDSMVEEHRREEEELHSQLKSDEEIRISAEIAALSKVEESVERKKRELAEEMARRNELAASESEKTEIAHEHQVQLKSLEESLRADKINSQKALGKIHEDMRLKLRKAKEEMRAAQRASEQSVRADFEHVKAEVEKKIEEKGVKIEGVDLRAIEQQLHAAQTGPPTAKQQALQNFHLQTQQEMAKKQQSDERRLAEEAERERQKELDLLDRQLDARRDTEMGELEARLKAERDSLGDEEQAKALLLQHQNQLRTLGVQLDAEKAAQRAHLNAALAKKRKAKEAKLRAAHQLELEKELFEQKQELDSIAKTGAKKKEVEALAFLLTRENYKKGKALIERIIRPRQHKEVSALIQDNFKETALSLSENLEKSMASAAQHREEIDRRLAAKEISQEEAEREYKLVEAEVDPDAIKASTLQYLEPQQNEKLTQQKRAHLQEVKDLMKKFYPTEDFSGAEWMVEEASVNVGDMLREGEERKRRQEEAFELQLKELEAQQQAQLAEFEERKAARAAELAEKLKEDEARQQAEFDSVIAQRKKEFEEAQKKEAERAMAIEMEALEARERAAKAREQAAEEKAAAAAAAAPEGEAPAAVAAAQAAASAEAAELAAERAAIAREREEVLAELAKAQSETAKQQELEAERQRKRFAMKLAEKADAAKRAELAKLEEEHAKSMEQQKKNLASSADKLKKLSEEDEARKQESILLAARAFIRNGRAYADHRDIGVKYAVRRIRKVYDNARRAGRINFSLVPGPVAGTMLQVPLQPGMAIIGGGGAVAGEGSVGLGGGVAGGMGMGLGMAFPGTGEGGQPFFNKLEHLENTLSKLLHTGHDGLFQADVLPYVAPGEQALEPKASATSIIEVPLLDLSPKKFVLYRFGLFILDFLAEAHSIAHIRLLLVKSLPPRVDGQKYLENPFRNSFLFEPARRILFVRVERTEEVGEFTLLLVHCVSHILAKEWSDAHPKFQESFHRSLQFICSELFFARTKKGYSGFGGGAGGFPSLQQIAYKKQSTLLLQPGEVSSSSAAAASASAALSSSSLDDAILPSEGIGYKDLQSLFGLVPKLEFREDLVGEFIDLHQSGSQGDELFGEEALVQRMEQYKLFNYSQPLAGFLRDLERSAVANKQEANLAARTNATRNKNMPRVGAVGDKDSSSGLSAAAVQGKPRRGSLNASTGPTSGLAKESSALSTRDRLKASIERLLEESDSLHSQLLVVIGAMAPVSESLLALQELHAKLVHARVPHDSPQLVEATLERKKVQARLRRLHLQKDALNQRIEHVEETYKKKMNEMGQTK